ncbi:MAG: hypothetical protein ACLQAH_18630 [Limisphaerales bacterium]
MLAAILFQVIEFTLQTVFLFALLGLMIKIQKFDRRFELKFVRVLGTAALVTGLDLFLQKGLGPLIGLHFATYISIPIGFVVLWYCVKRSTGADYVEAFFTVVISSALMFAINLLLLGSLMDNLRAHVENTHAFEVITRPRTIKRAGQPLLGSTNAQVLQTNLPVLQTNPPVLQTNPPVPGTATNPTKPDLGKPAPGSAAKTNLPAQTTNQTPQSASTNLVVTPPAKPIEVNSKYFSVKGVTRNGANSAVTIQSGTKVYSVFLNEAVLMQTAEGPISVRFTDLGQNTVTLEINGEPAKYLIH